MKKLNVLLSLCIIAVMLLPACAPAPQQEVQAPPSAPTAASQPTTPPPAPSATGTVDYNLQTEPQGIDPGVAGDYGSMYLDDALFMGLVVVDPVTGELTNELATSVDVSPDGLTWTYKMRTDVPWVSYNPSTGEFKKERNITAHDVEYAVKRVADPKTYANYAYILYDVVKNLREVNVGQAGLTVDDVGVKALDDATVQFTLAKPAGYFPYILAMQTARPEPREPIEKFGDKWVEPGNIWVSGAYTVQEWTHNSHMTLVKNPYYVDAANVQIQQINFVMISDMATQLAMFETGKLDTISGLPPDDVQRVKSDATLSSELHSQPNMGALKLNYTNTKPPMDDVTLRHALTAAIDRQAIVDNVTKGGEIPATTYAPPGVFGAVPPSDHIGQDYDPELAKQLFQEYLTKHNQTVDQFNQKWQLTFGAICRDIDKRVQAALAAMWKETLGIEFKTECQDWKIFAQTYRKETPVEEIWHVHSVGWAIDYPDQSDYISFYASTAENIARRGCADPNCTKFTDNEFDKIVRQADTSTDPALRQQLYKRAEQILFEEEFAWAPLYWRVDNILTQPWLQRNFPLLDKPDFKNWKIDMEAKQAG